MMDRCIYCETQLVVGAADGSEPSLEHVVQYAIGGSDGLSTKDVCNRCNSTLGDTVDARFIHNKLIGFARLQHDLEGHGGTVSDVSIRATTTEAGRAAEIRFKRNAEVEFHHRPDVIRETLQDGSEKISVGGTRDQALQIADGLLKKAKKSGGTMRTSAGHEIGSASDLLEGAEVEIFASYTGQMTIDMTDIYAGVAKIAFAFAHLVMGPSWTFSPVASPLRKVARGRATLSEAEACLKGGDEKLRGIFKDVSAEDTSHVVGLIPSSPTRVLVSLFGGQGMTYAVDVGQLVDLLDANRFGAFIDIQTRKTTWIGLAEVAARTTYLSPSS